MRRAYIGKDMRRGKRSLTLLLLIAATVIVSLLPSALCGRAASSVFRPPVSSEARLSDSQRLELTLNALAQQLVFGEVHGGIVRPEAVSQGLRARAKSNAEKSVQQVCALPAGRLLAVACDKPQVDGDIATVPVRLIYKEVGAHPKATRMSETKDTLFLELRSTGGWVLPLPALPPGSAVRSLLDCSSAGKISAAGAAAAFASTAADFSGLESDSMLLPKWLHPQVSVLNSVTSGALFGDDILSVPWGVSCVQTYDYLETHHYHEYFVVADWSWCRMLGADNTEGWIATHGSAGDGADHFRLPMGVCGDGHTFWIADAFSNRIVTYYLWPAHNNETGGVIYVGEKTGNFNYPTDVDWRGNGYHSCMVVADNGHGQIKRFTSGWLDRTFGSPGSGPQQFMNPTSVSFGRDLAGAQTVEFFVADRGNARVTSVDSNAAYPNFVWRSTALPGTDLISVDVDNFGCVYALDAAEGKIYKFSNLLVPLGVHSIQSSGLAIYPKAFAIVHGQDCGADPDSCVPTQPGDALLTQSYTATTGVHRYGLGVNVRRADAMYDAANEHHPDTAYVVVSYHLTDAGSVSVVGRYEGEVAEFSWGPASQVAGPQTVVIPLRRDLDFDYSGHYVISIAATSIYSGSNSDVAYVDLDIDTSFNHVPVITSGPTPVCSPPCACLHNNMMYTFRVQAADPGGVIEYYRWEAGYGGIFDNGQDTITSETNEVNCQVSFDFGPAVQAQAGVLRPEDTALWVRAFDDRGAPSRYALLHGYTVCCDCPCHADPECNGVTNVNDIVMAVDVAFRGEAKTVDALCPYARTDVDCTGVTDVNDVVRFVNVALRAGSRAANFCRLCP